MYVYRWSAYNNNVDRALFIQDFTERQTERFLAAKTAKHTVTFICSHVQQYVRSTSDDAPRVHACMYSLQKECLVRAYLHASSSQNNKGDGHAKGVAANANEGGEEATECHGAPQQPQPAPHTPPADPPCTPLLTLSELSASSRQSGVGM